VYDGRRLTSAEDRTSPLPAQPSPVPAHPPPFSPSASPFDTPPMLPVAMPPSSPIVSPLESPAPIGTDDPAAINQDFLELLRRGTYVVDGSVADEGLNFGTAGHIDFSSTSRARRQLATVDACGCMGWNSYLTPDGTDGTYTDQSGNCGSGVGAHCRSPGDTYCRCCCNDGYACVELAPCFHNGGSGPLYPGSHAPHGVYLYPDIGTKMPGVTFPYYTQCTGTNRYDLSPVPTQSFTLVAEFKTNSVWAGSCGSGTTHWHEGCGLMDAHGSGANDFGLTMSAGRIMFGVGNPDTTIISPSSYADNTYHRAVATWDHTSGAMALEIDGIIVGIATGPTADRTASIITFCDLQSGGSSWTGKLTRQTYYMEGLPPSLTINADLFAVFDDRFLYSENAGTADWFVGSTSEPSTPQWTLEHVSHTAQSGSSGLLISGVQVRIRDDSSGYYLNAGGELAQADWTLSGQTSSLWQLTWSGDLTDTTVVTIKADDGTGVEALHSNSWSNNGGNGAYSWGDSTPYPNGLSYHEWNIRLHPLSPSPPPLPMPPPPSPSPPPPHPSPPPPTISPSPPNYPCPATNEVLTPFPLTIAPTYLCISLMLALVLVYTAQQPLLHPDEPALLLPRRRISRILR
jgi:hypothetical protein